MRADQKMCKTARRRLVEMHFKAGVGHLGGNLSCIDALLSVFSSFVAKKDYVILSKGHSAGALYVSLWATGYIEEDKLETFHGDGTLLAGHPPVGFIPEIPFSTGSLGHGLSISAGVALGLRIKNLDGRVYCIMSDGEWQEGSTWEALIFSCHNRLSNLTILVDHNELQGFGGTAEIASMSPLWEKIKGFDCECVVLDGHSVESINYELTKKQTKLKIIFLQTTKGKGLSFFENRMDSHYLPLTESEYLMALKELQ